MPARRTGQAPRERNSSKVKTPWTSCPSGCSRHRATAAIRPVNKGTENAVLCGVGSHK
ncbi:MAG: hypothetical protein WCK53_14870 [Methanomicrobiales archaeon]